MPNGRFPAEVDLAMVEDKCRSIVLGCIGMASLAARLSVIHGLPVIDGVVAATGMLNTLHAIEHSMTPA